MKGKVEEIRAENIFVKKIFFIILDRFKHFKGFYNFKAGFLKYSSSEIFIIYNNFIIDDHN